MPKIGDRLVSDPAGRYHVEDGHRIFEETSDSADERTRKRRPDTSRFTRVRKVVETWNTDETIRRKFTIGEKRNADADTRGSESGTI